VPQLVGGAAHPEVVRRVVEQDARGSRAHIGAEAAALLAGPGTDVDPLLGHRPGGEGGEFG
jgi:hypothetical protein